MKKIVTLWGAIILLSLVGCTSINEKLGNYFELDTSVEQETQGSENDF